MKPKKRNLIETIFLSIIFYYFEFTYYLKSIRDNRECKRHYQKLKREEKAFMDLILSGIWGFEDPYVRGEYIRIKKGLLRFKDEKFYTTKILKG